MFGKYPESVQGYEQAIIIYFVAVGPDETGRLVSTVLSLNKDGGHHRLKVATTRARRELVLFASLRPENMDLWRTRVCAIRGFKQFLELADRAARALSEAFTSTRGDLGSPLEAAGSLVSR